MRRCARSASVVWASRSVSSRRVSDSRSATRVTSSARSGPSISAPSCRRSRRRSLSCSARSRRISASGEREVGAQACWGERRLVARCRGARRTAGLHGLAAACGVEVFADAVGVEQPGGHAGGSGDGGRGDRGVGGLQGVDSGQGAAAFVVAVFGPGRPQPGGAIGGGHPVSPSGAGWAITGSCRATRARRSSLLACSTSSRSWGASSASRRCICSATWEKARISAVRLSVT